MSSVQQVDLIVVGSGAGGLSTAVVAKKRGLNVVVLEKAPVFGGTTAFSGGVLWIPGNSVSKAAGVHDTKDAALEYMKNETGEYFNEAAVDLFLEKGPEMVDFFQQNTTVQFIPTLYPDYHPTVPGGVDIGRSILAKPFDIRELGKEKERLRPPLETITFIGMMFNSSNADLKHFFNATKSLRSFLYVVKRLANHIKELALYKRGVHVTSGNALAARLAKSAFDLGIPILTSTAVVELIEGQEGIAGVRTQGAEGEKTILAKHGVVLAAGGFPHDKERLKHAFPHVQRGGTHHSPAPIDNTGDGVRLAESVGADFQVKYPSAAAWMPVSLPPLSGGRQGVFPHLLDRYKPGVVGVNRYGQRFTNESESYHDVGAAMIKDGAQGQQTEMWLICDQKTMSKYGLGYAKPAPMPLGGLIKSGYLLKGQTLADLALQCGINAQRLEQTIAEYNVGAKQGKDTQFQRGETSFNRYLADPEHQPNPCVAPVEQGPFYAVHVLMGDLGTFDGIQTSVTGEALRSDGTIIPNLYVVGNDRASIMGGNYPGAGITLGPILTFGYVTANAIADKAQQAKGDHCAN
ncbi:FAD-dependent oxidoreductase [Paenalcaligenes hominis]|uniref:FAD-dependent oxidoreductase n=1 Tax=Paenalcaligenes hominis TaxID=643674 RepID=UPI0035253671